MGLWGNGWNSERQTLIFTCLPTDKETRGRHGEGLPDAAWMRSVYSISEVVVLPAEAKVFDRK